MTTPIPAGTCNLPINLLTEERQVLQKLAYSRGLSVGEYLRRVIRRGVALSQPAEAKRLAKLRRERFGCASLLIVFLGSLVFGSDTVARPVRLARSGRTSITRRWEEA